MLKKVIYNFIHKNCAVPAAHSNLKKKAKHFTYCEENIYNQQMQNSMNYGMSFLKVHGQKSTLKIWIKIVLGERNGFSFFSESFSSKLNIYLGG